MHIYLLVWVSVIFSSSNSAIPSTDLDYNAKQFRFVCFCLFVFKMLLIISKTLLLIRYQSKGRQISRRLSNLFYSAFDHAMPVPCTLPVGSYALSPAFHLHKDMKIPLYYDMLSPLNGTPFFIHGLTKLYTVRENRPNWLITCYDIDIRYALCRHNI